MLNRIKKLDNKLIEKPTGNTRFYTYFAKFKNELCSVTVAVRNHYKKWYCKQVVVMVCTQIKCSYKTKQRFKAQQNAERKYILCLRKR